MSGGDVTSCWGPSGYAQRNGLPTGSAQRSVAVTGIAQTLVDKSALPDRLRWYIMRYYGSTPCGKSLFGSTGWSQSSVSFTRSRFTRKPCARSQFTVNQGPGKGLRLNVDSLRAGLRPRDIPHEPGRPRRQARSRDGAGDRLTSSTYQRSHHARPDP